MNDSRRGRNLVMAIGFLVALGAAGMASAAERALWLRYPAISPDGRTVAFSYRGNLWKVAATGGTAEPLTVSDAYNTMPVWSPDGTRIAFASDRYGNFDVFVMPAEGGEATRLTFHSADETPTSFTPDGKAVLFTAAILDSAANVLFPTPAQPELYRVGLDGGMPEQVLTTPAPYAVYDRAGTRLAYSDVKGFEHEWRKHDTSSFARDLVLYDVASGKHTQLTPPGADNRQPVWGPGDTSLFFLSERSGSFNVWRLELADPQHPVQVTTHTGSPVRFLSASRNGDLCYAFDGEIWVRPAGAAESRRLEVSVSADQRTLAVEPIDVTDEVTEFDVAPDGSEIAFIARGEVFVASTEHGTTRRITNTPEQERSVSFSPDGRSLLYASERGGSWKLYRTDLTDKDEPNFFNATALKETPVLESDLETFQPHFSPDGTEIAYLEERTTLKVLNLKTGASRTILPGDLNYSYSDGDQWYEWSPDGRWFAVQFLSHTRWSSEVGLIPASGEGRLVNVTKSGYEDVVPQWAMKGEVLFWLTDRQGLRSQAGEGREQDVYAAFLTGKAWDRFRLDEAAFGQLEAKDKEKEKDKEKATEKGKEKGAGEAKGAKLPEPVAIEFDRLDDRVARLSLASADLAGAALSPDGETVYYLAKFEKGFDLWKYVPRKKEVKLLAKLDAKEAGLKLGRDGKKAFVLADNRLSTVELESGKTSPVRASAKMDLKPAAERAYMFEHAWRQTFKKFLDVKMHGVDWKAMKAAYARFLPYIDNDRDFAELISEMQGELNASHTGGRFRPMRQEGDATAALGFFPGPQAHRRRNRSPRGRRGRAAAEAGDPDQARRGDRGDRRDEDPGRRELVPAAQPQGGHAGASRALRPQGRHALGGERQADLVGGAIAPAVRALGALAARRGGPAVGRAVGVRAHPRHVRRRLPRDLRGDLRAGRGQGRDRPRHAVQRRGQPGGGADGVPEREGVREGRAARPAGGDRAGGALDQALYRHHGGGELLRRALLPDGVHAARPRRDGRHAGPGDVLVGVVGAPAGPQPRVRDSGGRARRHAGRRHGEQAAGAHLPGGERPGGRRGRAGPAAREGGRGFALEAAQALTSPDTRRASSAGSRLPGAGRGRARAPRRSLRIRSALDLGCNRGPGGRVCVSKGDPGRARAPEGKRRRRAGVPEAMEPAPGGERWAIPSPSRCRTRTPFSRERSRGASPSAASIASFGFGGSNE